MRMADRADHGDRPLGRADQLVGARERGVGRRRDLRGGRRRRQRLVGGGERHVLRQVEMHRPLRLAQRERDGLRQRLGDRAPFRAAGWPW